ncbi:DUF4139 domain-containing protein [Streptomyces justiciae]|uniref:DUF4139 domain-containing protein n=1 Tax=Streptomyces justiciae TaxID=2780140 RepID=A0ABU3LWF4_9ACTN|nr:DUF4139 domain-containing protein [Streptomyces justiciae]MDT7843413.1 DUF4139 domain-containing protein [Streptomyces justiciae]
MKSEGVPRWASALDAVVVYAQGALCSRLARGTVPPDGRVLVTGLPRTVDPGSVRARVTGDSGARVTSVRVEVEAEPADGDSADGLRQERERLEDACAAARARHERLLVRIKEITELRPVPPPRKRDDPDHHRRTPAEAWLTLGDFVDERLTRLYERLAESAEELRRLEHDLSVAVDRCERASTSAPSGRVLTTVCAAVTLDGGTGEVGLEIEYGVPGAVWVPAYRLTCRQGDDSGTLVLRAGVAQRTGEDWTGVRIALATADLGRGAELPRLRSLRIGRRQPAPEPSGWREPPAGLADLFTAYDAAGPRPAPASAPVHVGAVTRSPDTYGAALPPVPPAGVPVPPARPAYGGMPPAPAAPGGLPAPVASAQAAQPRRAAALHAAPQAAPAAAPAAPSGAMAPPPAPPAPPVGPPQPSSAELDYAALVLSGPEEPAARRGRLFPAPSFDAVAVEHRRRAEAVAALPLPAHAVRPRASAGSFDHRYDAVARADVPSDGTWHTVTVGRIPVGLRTEYVCVPSVEQRVYAALVLSNATDQALLAGPVEVRVDDDFVVSAALPTLAPGGARRMGLGPAESIRVTRRTSLKESTAGLRNNVTVLAHGVHVELVNTLGEPVTVEVREQVPTTAEADIRIEEQADWTVPEDTASADAPDPGTRVWRVDLPAGGTATRSGGYEIRIPAAKALVGGNRRS